MRCLVFILSICFCNIAFAERGLSVAFWLQSNMVVQQGKPLKIMGKANAGDNIFIKADWMKQPINVKADKQNNWVATINVPRAVSGNFDAHKIVITANKTTIQLDNILIGEVWLCSGQSNMDMTLKPFLPWMQGVIDYEHEIAMADHPQIRLLDIITDFKNYESDTARCTDWKICSPSTAGDFSAVAYYFALKIFNELHVPVGLVTSAVGGSACQAWTSRETLASATSLNKKYLYPYDTSAAAKEILDTTLTFEKVCRPTLFYNAMLYPLRNISLRGFLWYQGESNKDDGAIYAKLNIAMIENWRKLFAQGDLPFYYVQIAPYNLQQHDSTAFDYAIFREVQQAILKEKNTGMALTMDVGDADDIHPRHKKEVGTRLALIALAKTYGISNTVYQGPQFSSYKISGDSVVITFDKATVASGLTTSDNHPPRYFFIAGDDKQFYAADAKIAGDKIILHADGVAHPVAVRYAFTNYPVTNFCNKEGLPAMPFRTDNRNVIPSSNKTAR